MIQSNVLAEGLVADDDMLGDYEEARRCNYKAASN
jgi:hypothetical protein